MDKTFTLVDDAADELEIMDATIDGLEDLLNSIQNKNSDEFSAILGMYYKMLNTRNVFVEQYAETA